MPTRYLLENQATGEIIELDACSRAEACQAARTLAVMHNTTVRLVSSDGFSVTYGAVNGQNQSS